MKYIPFSLIFFSSLIFSQSLINEIKYLPGEGNYDIYYSFRIPYNGLLFEKTGESFSSEYEVLVELLDSTGLVKQRVIKDEKVNVPNYELTNSNEIFSEGLIQLSAPGGKYKITAVFSDKKNSKEYRAPERDLILEELTSVHFLPPLFIYSNKTDCDGDSSYRIVNYEGNIPLSEETVEIIIPINDPDIAELDVQISKDDLILLDTTVSEGIKGKLIFKDCDIIGADFNETEDALGYFILKGFSLKLTEGVYSLNLSDSKLKDKRFEFSVKWYNRPVSLSDPENAILALKYIISEDEIEKILDNDVKEFRKALNDYWIKYDPTPGTSFNPLMNEFYERIDYAAKSFASLNKNGVSTDRGKVFIKFGKPTKIERDYSANGGTIETWLYEKNKFIFVDEKGTGDFLLIKG